MLWVYILWESDYIEINEIHTVEIYYYLHSNTVGMGVLVATRVKIRTALPYQHVDEEDEETYFSRSAVPIGSMRSL